MKMPYLNTVVNIILIRKVKKERNNFLHLTKKIREGEVHQKNLIQIKQYNQRQEKFN